MRSTTKNRLTRDHLAAMRAKLQRVDDITALLDSELREFLRPRPTAFSEVITVPPRFSVMVGEVAHQLRSILDQLVWHLSDENFKRKNERHIGFPIHTSEPLGRKLNGYELKIGGLDPEVRNLVTKLQPYRNHRRNPRQVGESLPANDPLAVIHDLNRIDKHQNLLRIESLVRIEVRLPVDPPLILRAAYQKKPMNDALPPPPSGGATFQPYVVLDGVGRANNERVVASLRRLTLAVSDIVDQFVAIAGPD